MLGTVLLVLLVAAADEAPAVPDAVHLGKALGISTEAAESRMRLADRLSIFELRVRSDPDFAGAYLEHEPRVQAVVMFKGDAAVKLRRYVSDDAFVARSVEYSIRDLAEAQAKLPELFEDAGLEFVGTEQDLEANRVLVHVVDDAPVRKAMAAGKLALPKPAQLSVIEGDIATEPQRAGPVTNFPQARYPMGAGMHALVSGKLFERGGCLRIGEENGESHLILWPSAARLTEEGGSIAVRDGTAGGQLIVGADVAISGGAAPGLPPPEWLLAPVTPACAGPYWIAARGW